MTCCTELRTASHSDVFVRGTWNYSRHNSKNKPNCRDTQDEHVATVVTITRRIDKESMEMIPVAVTENCLAVGHEHNDRADLYKMARASSPYKRLYIVVLLPWKPVINHGLLFIVYSKDDIYVQRDMCYV